MIILLLTDKMVIFFYVACQSNPDLWFYWHEEEDFFICYCKIWVGVLTAGGEKKNISFDDCCEKTNFNTERTGKCICYHELKKKRKINGQVYLSQESGRCNCCQD